MIKPKDAINAGVVKKQYILGRRDDSEAMEAMRPTYMKENIGDSIKKREPSKVLLLLLMIHQRARIL
ncbi:hypothetical protein [Methanococcoides sp.]|uniref:hypothetical protein n=1 Tax=Methanococcoides sp. TaxID=1966350 RepID=UPI00272EE672|nr:hypothetical protein [Methanococcoides sp.]